MARFPVLGIWTDAYLSDTMHLTTVEHGAYLLMLMTAWRDPLCSLPNDDRKLAAMTRMNANSWKTHKATLMEFWEVQDGRLIQKRLRLERQKVEALIEKKRAAGISSSESRRRLNGCSTHAEHVLNTRGNTTPTEGQPLISYSYANSKEEEKESFSLSPPSSSTKIEKPKLAVRPENREECVQFVTNSLGLQSNDGQALFDHWAGNGFKVNGKPMASWKHTASNWARRGIFFPSLNPSKRR